MYTSVLTLVELLNGLTKNDQEFRHRRSAISAIFRSGIPIDWQMPQCRLRSAFGLLRAKYDVYEKRVSCIQVLAREAIRAESVTGLLLREGKLRLPHGLKYFRDLDHSISHTFIEAARKWIPSNRQQFRTEQAGDYLEYIGVPRRATLPEIAKVLGGSGFDCGFGLYALTGRFSEEEGQRNFEFHDQLFRSYDGSLDLYLRALSHQVWREIGHAEMPGRNCGADLTHLQYVAENSIVATEDEGMAARIMEANGATLSANELIAA